MLRLISIIGIAIAMLIGFIAISTNMKEDYAIRSRVVSVLKQMKNLATEELRCGLSSDITHNNQAEKEDSETAPAIEMSVELDTTPLIKSPASAKIDPANEPLSSETTDNQIVESSDSTDSTQATEMNERSKVENTDIGENRDIIKTMGYRVHESGNMEITVVFNDINGESGKTRVKSGSRVVIECTCPTGKLACETVESNINKNYLPKHLTRE